MNPALHLMVAQYVLLVVFAFASATSAEAQVENYDFPLSAEQLDFELAPGASIEVRLTLGNTTAQTSPELWLRVSSYFGNGYTVSLMGQTTSCGELVDEPGSWAAIIRVQPIPAGGDRVCVLTVSREPTERDFHSLFISLNRAPPSDAPWAYLSLSFGTFVDVHLLAEAESRAVSSNGTAHAIYRLTAHNTSSLDLDPMEIGVGQTCIVEPVQIDADMAGGCTLADGWCWFGGSPSGTVVQLPGIAAGQTTSCLIRISEQQAANASIVARLPHSFVDATTGGAVLESDASNNSQTLYVNAGNGNGAATAALPAISVWSLLLLALALGALGLRARARYR